MKIAVMGSKDFKNKELIWNILAKELSNEKTEIIIGGTDGVYGIAKEYCERENIPYEIIHPIDNKDISGLFKNIEIITKSDKIIIFWDKISKGTKFAIDYAKARKKQMHVYDDQGFKDEGGD